MAKIILDILALIIGAAIGYGIFNARQTATSLVTGVVAGGAIIIGSWLVIGSFGVIPAGDVGVKLQWSKPTGELVQNGWYVAPAFFGQSVYVLPSSQVRQYPVNNIEAASKDLQQVTTDVMFNFHLNQDPKSVIMVYSTLRDSFDGIITPLTIEGVKTIASQYTANDLIDKRPEAKQKLDNLLETRLSRYGIVVDNISLTQFRFSPQFNEAIEAKVTQEQQALQAQAKLAQVQWEAKQTVAQANADATALRLKRVNLTPLLVQEEWINKWHGDVPTVMGGGGLGLMLPSGIFGSEQK